MKNKGWWAANFQYLLAGFILLLTFIIFFVIIFVSIEDTNKDVIIYLLGVLSAISTQIVSYYYGSSSGSKEKTEMMNKPKANETEREIL